MSTISTSPSLVSVHSSMPGLMTVSATSVANGHSANVVIEDDDISSVASGNDDDNGNNGWGPVSPDNDPWGARPPATLESLDGDLQSIRNSQTTVVLNLHKIQDLVEGQHMIVQSLRPAIIQSSHNTRNEVRATMTKGIDTMTKVTDKLQVSLL
jgi:hypothetical protein